MTDTIPAAIPAAGYDAFLAAAREVEAIIRARPDTTEADLAEGYAYIAGMWIFSLDRAFRSFDLDRPCFVRDMDPFRSWGCGTPDHHYFSAQIDGEAEYRILGHRGSTVDYCFEVLTGLASDGGVIGARVDALEARRLQFEADGRFELFVGGPPREGDWLKAGPTATAVFVRQTVADWRLEQPTPMLIERLGETPPFARPTMASVQALYQTAADSMVNNIRFQDGFSLNWMKTLPVNDLPAPSVGPPDGGYFPGQYNSKAVFRLAPGEALLVSLEPPTAAYFSLTLAHPHWFNTIHGRNVQSSLSGAQAHLSSDGLYHLVIAASDPGVANWIDTSGLETGFMFMRVQGVRGKAPASPRCALISIAALRDALPADDPVVDAKSRAAAARMRRLSADRRFA